MPKLSHDLLVGGYMVQEAGFDKRLNCGMGGAFIREVDPRSMTSDPLCPDIGDGRAVFKFVPYPRAWFRQHYPDKEREMEADGLLLKPVRDSLLTVSDEDSIMLIECWLREYDPDTDRIFRKDAEAGRRRAAGGTAQSSARRAIHAHGEYPFAVTALYPEEGQLPRFRPCGHVREPAALFG